MEEMQKPELKLVPEDPEDLKQPIRLLDCPFTPLGQYIIVRMHTVEEKTLTGLYMPDLKKEGIAKGIVVATNSGQWVLDGTSKVPSNVSIGEFVYFFKQNAFEIPHTGFFLIPEQILLCKEKNNKVN